MGLGLEILENTFLEGFCSDFRPWAWKYLQIAAWKSFGATFAPEPGNPSKKFPGTRPGRFLDLGLEMLKDSPLEAFWGDF